MSQDANYNVTTLTDLAGRVLERVFYTEYGQPIIESLSYFGDYDGDGDVDATDLSAADTTTGACRGSSPTGACRVLDLDQDGDVDGNDAGTDYETLSGLINAAPTTNRVHHARRSSAVGNLFLHQGLVYDAEIGAYQNRQRNYHAGTERFFQKDPAGYYDGLNSYEYLGANPVARLDPSGLGYVCCAYSESHAFAPPVVKHRWAYCGYPTGGLKSARQACCASHGMVASDTPSCGTPPGMPQPPSQPIWELWPESASSDPGWWGCSVRCLDAHQGLVIGAVGIGIGAKIPMPRLIWPITADGATIGSNIGGAISELPRCGWVIGPTKWIVRNPWSPIMLGGGVSVGVEAYCLAVCINNPKAY